MTKQQEIEQEIAKTQAQLEALSKKLKDLQTPSSEDVCIHDEDGDRPGEIEVGAELIRGALFNSTQWKFLKEKGHGVISSAFLHISNMGVTDSLGLFLGNEGGQRRVTKWEIVTVRDDFMEVDCQILMATPVADLLRAEGKLPAKK